MELYSYKGQYPQKLPERLRLENNFTVTSLDTLSIEELNSLGFNGPFVIPNFSPEKEELIWDGNQFLVKEIDTSSNIVEEIPLPEICLDEAFKSQFKFTRFFKKIRALTKEYPEMGVLYNELYTYISRDNCKLKEFEIYLTKILLFAPLSDIEKQDLFKLIEKFSYQEYFYLDIFNGEFEYDFESDRVTNSIRGPFKSWTMNENSVYIPPVEYPTDGDLYEWDEQSISWKKVVI